MAEDDGLPCAPVLVVEIDVRRILFANLDISHCHSPSVVVAWLMFAGAHNGDGRVVGCFGGYQACTWLVKELGAPDLYVALLKHQIAIVD